MFVTKVFCGKHPDVVALHTFMEEKVRHFIHAKQGKTIQERT